MIHLFSKTWNLHRFLNYLFVFALHLIFDSFRVVFFYHYIHYHQVLLLSANLLFQIVVNIWVTLFSLVMHHACNAIYCCIKFEMKLNHDDNDLLISFTRVLPAPTGQVVMLWLSYWWQWFSSGNYSDLGAIVSRAWIGCFVRRVGKSLETAFVHKHVNCLQIFSWSFPQIFFLMVCFISGRARFSYCFLSCCGWFLTILHIFSTTSQGTCVSSLHRFCFLKNSFLGLNIPFDWNKTLS